MNNSEPVVRRIGEISAATRMTVRTLHYYEEIGLITSTSRSDAGHRLYVPAALEQLYRIAFLRQLGLPLDGVRATMASEPGDVRSVMADHLDAVEARLATEHRLRNRLVQLLDAIDTTNEAAPGDLMNVLEDMTMLETNINRRISILVYADIEAAHDYLIRVFGLGTFVAIDQEESDGTDGALQDVMGPDGEPTGERYIALDVTGSSVELERTIVHETGHLIFAEPGGAPTDYFIAFNEQFPPGAEYFEDDFVTEYASSVEDGGEDIAESWAMFVFGETDFAGDADDHGELDVVPDGTLAAEKVAFFEDYPELVELKEDILS